MGLDQQQRAWEELYSSKLESVEFVRGASCGVVFYHEIRDISLAVHGDDLRFFGGEIDLLWIKTLLPTWFEVKFRSLLGHDEKDDQEIIIVGRTLRWTQD